MAVQIALMVRPVPSLPCLKPSSTASTAPSSDSPRSQCSSGAKRTSAYTTPSSARSSAHSRATRTIESAVCITPTVWANVSRYRARSLRFAPRRIQAASVSGSEAGRLR